MREYFKVGGAEFVGSVLTQITNNRFHDVLAQITRDNFFYGRTRIKKRCVLTQITINRFQDVLAQITRDIFFL